MVLVPGFSHDYYVSEEGKLYSYKFNKLTEVKGCSHRAGRTVYLIRKGEKEDSTFKLIDIVAAAYRPELFKRPATLVPIDGDKDNLKPENIGIGTLRTNYKPQQNYLIKVFNIPTDEFYLSDEEFEEEYNKWRPYILEEIRYYNGRNREEIDHRESYVANLLYRYMKYGIWEKVEYKKRYLERMCKFSGVDYFKSMVGDRDYKDLTDKVITEARKSGHFTEFQQEMVDNSYTEETGDNFTISDALKSLPAAYYDIVKMLQSGYKLNEIYEKYTADEVSSAVIAAKELVSQVEG